MNEKNIPYNRRKFITTAAKTAAATTIAMSGLPGFTFSAHPNKSPDKLQPDKKGVLTELDSYNIKWNTPGKNSADSMPLGGQDTGVNVWVENGDLLLYIQKSGSFDENGAYLKLGRIRLQLSPNPFIGYNSFRQELKLSEGFIEMEADKNALNTTIRLWVDANTAVVHVEISANENVSVTAAYESWRDKDRELPETGKERFSCFELEGYPGKVIKRKDTIAHTSNGVLFHHRNSDDKLIPEVLIKQQGLEQSKDEITDDLKNRTFGGMLTGSDFVPAGTTEGQYLSTPYRAWKIQSRQASPKHKLIIAGHIRQAKTLADWRSGLEEVVEKALTDTKSFSVSCRWWKEFWQRSHIFIFPGKPEPTNPVWQMARNYQLFRYQLGCNVAGEYPSKFNGGNFTFDPGLTKKEYDYDPDWRAWGGDVFTAQNQRLLYWPMLKSGDFDAITAQFELYRKALPGATARVKTHFGHKGAVYSEYIGVPGVAIGSGWGWVDARARSRGKEVPFGSTEINGLAGYGQTVEKGTMANPFISYHWESQLEHAYMILEYHRFTGVDIAPYMPFIKAALIFFDEHYRLRQKKRNGKELDENGKLLIYPSTSCETYRGATNPSDVVAGLKACLQRVIILDKKYISSEERKYFSNFLSVVPNYAFEEKEGKPNIKPAEKWLKLSNVELPQLYPLFPFDQFKMGDPEMPAFKNAYEQAPASNKGTVISWHQDGIFFARMGMTKEAANYNTQKLKDSERRFPTFWGPGHDWTPDHNWGGSGMIGLQEMLLQTIGDKIVILPAWPAKWDVSFKLHAPQNTVVEVMYKKGKIERLKVTPASRKKDIVTFLPLPR